MLNAESRKIRAHLAELRSGSVQATAVLVGICGWLGLAWALWPVVDDRLTRVQLRPVFVLLLVVAVTSYWLYKRLTLAPIILVGGLLAAIAYTATVLRTVEALQLFATPIIFASILLGQRALAVTTLMVIVFNLAVLPSSLNIGLDTVLVSTGMMCLIAGAMIISTQNLYTALYWVLHSFETAVQNRDIARDRQAELAQALKSLDISTQTLRRTNYALELAQKKAEQARQLKQQFAQTISHELRTPLNLIVGFTETMIKTPEYYGEALPVQYLRDLGIVHRNANHLQDLVNDVLDLARIEAAQMTLQFEQVETDTFLAEVTAMASAMVEPHHLEFQVEIASDLPACVWMDEVRIKQVLYNLLSNAVRFTLQGTVTLRVSRLPDRVIFAIDDTGIGIAKEDIPLIFEPFRQLENPMRRRIGGAGLGLPISLQLVTSHGGTLEVISEPGKGSTFSFNLPISMVKDSSKSSAVASRNPESKEDNIVLLVSQSPSAVALLSRHLDTYRPIVVSDLEQAQATIGQVIPQAVVIDTASELMKDADIGRLSAAWRLPQTVFIACPLPGESQLRQRLTADSILIKPLSRESLWYTLRQFGHKVDRILIVDDDQDFVRLVERMLSNALKRYQIMSAYSGQEALAIMRHQRPDLILLDLQMPDINGFQLVEQLHSNPAWHDIYVVIVSAQDEVDTLSNPSGKVEIMKVPGLTQSDIIKWISRILL